MELVQLIKDVPQMLLISTNSKKVRLRARASAPSGLPLPALAADFH